jgi:cell division protein FtsZ
LGAGNQPDRGREAAIESIETVKKEIGTTTKMIFITAGMGGGTGTGAAPVIAKATKEMGILTVGIVTIPFRYEGAKRLNQAIEGIKEMSKNVDSLLVINNEKLREMYGDFEASKALAKADEVLTVAAKGIAEIITKKGHINVDFADVKTVMKDSGIALMGTGVANGEERAVNAVKAALISPLLDNNNIQGARDILLNIASGTKEATMDEISFINEYVQMASGNKADLIWGSSKDEALEDNISVTVIATGFGTRDINEIYLNQEAKKYNSDVKINLNEDVNVIDSFTDDDDGIPFEIEGVDEDDSEFGTKVFKISAEGEYDENEEEKFDKGMYLKTDNSEKSTERETKTLVSKVSVKTNSENPYSSNSKTETDLSGYKTMVDLLEDVPAYIRKKVAIDTEKSYENENISKYTISTRGDEIFVGENNKFLDEKPD